MDESEHLSFRSGSAPYPSAELYRAERAGPRVGVVLGHGFSGTQDQLAPYARAFAEQGLSAMTFDYRHFGTSGGRPRQLVDVSEQLADWRAALAAARSLPELFADGIALWGSSFSGGHVLRLAAENPDVRAVVIQVPEFGLGAGTVREEVRAKRREKGVPLSTILLVSVRWLAAAARDEWRGRRGREPCCLPVFAPPGAVGAVIDPEFARFLTRAEETGPTWRNAFAARLLLHPPRYRRGTAEQVSAPMLVCVAEHDTETSPRAAAAVAEAAPRGEVLRYPVGHFEVYEPPWQDRLIRDQAEFLRRHLLGA